MIALLALFSVACGRSSGGSSGMPTAPTMPTVPSLPTAQVDGGQWAQRAGLIEPNSELALAELNGKLYLLGGYPANRQTARTVQVYDIASGSWQLGPPLPQPNNHGMAAGVNGRVYLIGGQTMADAPTYVDTVYELDPAKGAWVEKARMPTARSSGVAVVHDGKIYVAGGRPPRGSDFAVYDTRSDSWQVLPPLPTQRNHFTGAAINGRIHFVGGRQGDGLSPLMTTVHEVYDPQSGSWTTAAPMLRARSGMNGVMARGCFHVWGGEGPAGMFPDHDYYDPRSNQWIHLRDMPIPVHGVYGSAFVDGRDLGLRRRHQYWRQPRQLAQPGLLSDGELRLTRVLCRFREQPVNNSFPNSRYQRRRNAASVGRVLTGSISKNPRPIGLLPRMRPRKGQAAAASRLGDHGEKPRPQPRVRRADADHPSWKTLGGRSPRLSPR